MDSDMRAVMDDNCALTSLGDHSARTMDGTGAGAGGALSMASLLMVLSFVGGFALGSIYEIFPYCQGLFFVPTYPRFTPFFHLPAFPIYSIPGIGGH